MKFIDSSSVQYELTNSEKCRKLPPVWKRFAVLRKNNNDRAIDLCRKLFRRASVANRHT